MTCVCGATEGHKSQRGQAANEQWLHSSSASVQRPRWRAISEHNPACDRTADWVSRGVTAQGASWAVRFGTEFGLRPPILMNAARIRMRERGPAPALLAWRPTCGTHIAVAKLCAHTLAANARATTRSRERGTDQERRILTPPLCGARRRWVAFQRRPPWSSPWGRLQPLH